MHDLHQRQGQRNQKEVCSHSQLGQRNQKEIYYTKLVTHVESHASAVSLLEGGE